MLKVLKIIKKMVFNGSVMVERREIGYDIEYGY